MASYGSNPNSDSTSINDFPPETVFTSSSLSLTSSGIGVSPRRHAVLLLFFVSAFLNSLPFSHNFVGHAFMQFYQISESTVDMLALVFMGSFIVSFFPANCLFETRGLRFGVLIGGFLTAIGAWLFCASIGPSLFWVALISQTLIGLGQPFMLNVPPYLASIWFPAEEVSRACAVASFGAPLGILSGVAALPFVLSGQTWRTLHDQFLWYHVSYACAVSVVLVMILIVFRDQPEHPPSLARAEQIKNPTKLGAGKSIVILFKNRNYILHLLAFSLMNGLQNGFISIINQVILKQYPNTEDSFWMIGILLCTSGIMSCLLVGFFLDKSHRYKETSLALTVSAAGVFGIWTGTMSRGFVSLYVNVFIIGFFSTGYIPSGLELAAEITYPVSEVTTTSLLVVGGSVVGIALTFLGTWTLESSGILVTNLVFAAITLPAILLTVFVKSDLRRLKANSELANEGQIQ